MTPAESVAASRSGGEATAREIVLTSKVGEHSVKLQKALLDGKASDIQIVQGGGGKGVLRLTLKKAMVSNYSLSGSADEQMESWSLNFEAMEQAFEEGSGE